MLKLELQYFGHLMRRIDSLEKTLMLGKIEGGKRRGQQTGWDGWIASQTRRTWVWASSGSWWWTGKPGVLKSMGLQSWTLLSNWTELIMHYVTEESGGLQSTGSQRVGHDWATSLSLFNRTTLWFHSTLTIFQAPCNEMSVSYTCKLSSNLK